MRLQIRNTWRFVKSRACTAFSDRYRTGKAVIHSCQGVNTARRVREHQGMSACVPCVPCCCGWLTCYHSDVLWRVSHSRRGVALTIDDFPSKSLSKDAFMLLLAMLEDHGVCASFFVIWSRVKDSHTMKRMVLEMHRRGHEIALHYQGRWGWCLSEREYVPLAQSMLSFCDRNSIPVRFVRPPGGFATRSFIDNHAVLGLTTVIGTAYPGDADVCACMPSRWIGKCAARLASGAPGRIVILHVNSKLVAKVQAFLDANKRDLCTLAKLMDTATEAAIPLVRVKS